METRHYDVLTDAASDVTRILGGYARLTFTATKGRWWRLTGHLVFFEVTGPTEWLNKAEKEIIEAENLAQANRSW